MKKINYLLGAALTGLVLLGSCQEYAPSESVEKLRDSYSEKLNSESSLILANAALVNAQAEVEASKVAVEVANASLIMAQAADVQAEASIKIAEATVITSTVAIKEAEALQVAAETALIAADEVYRLAQADALKAESDASIDGTAAQTELVRAEVAVQMALAMQEEAAAANEAARLGYVEAEVAIKEAEALEASYDAQSAELDLQKATAELTTALATEANALQDAEILLAQNKLDAISDSITTSLGIQAQIDAAIDAEDLKEANLLQTLYTSYSSALSNYQNQELVVANAMSAVNTAKSAVNFPSSVGATTTPQYIIDDILASYESTLATRQADLEAAQASLTAAETVMEQQGVAAKITALNAEIAAVEVLIEGYQTRKEEIFAAYDVDAYEVLAVAYIESVVDFQNVLNPVALGQDPSYAYEATFWTNTSVLNNSKTVDYYYNNTVFNTNYDTKWNYAKYLETTSFDVAGNGEDTPAEALYSVKTNAEVALSNAEDDKNDVVKEDATYTFVKNSIDTLVSKDVELQAAMKAIFNSYDLVTGLFDQAKIDAYNEIVVDINRLCYSNIRYPQNANSDLYSYLNTQSSYIAARGGTIYHYPRAYSYSSHQYGTSMYIITSYDSNGYYSPSGIYVTSSVEAIALLENDAKWRAEDAALRVTDFEDYGWHQTLALNLAEKQAAVDAAQAVLDAIDEDQWITDFNAAKVAMASAWTAFEAMSEMYDELDIEYTVVVNRINNSSNLENDLVSIVNTELQEIKDAYEISGSSNFTYDELVSLYFEELVSYNESVVESAEYNFGAAEESLSNYQEDVEQYEDDIEAYVAVLEQNLASAELVLTEAQRQLTVLKDVLDGAATAYEVQVDVVY